MRIAHSDTILEEIRNELDGDLRLERDEIEPVTEPA